MSQSRKKIPVAASILFLFLAIYVTILAFADILDKRAEATINNWVESSNAPSPEVWNESIESLKLAQLLDPFNSEIPEKQGLLYQYSSLAFMGRSDKNIQAHERALVFFKQAAERRPTWAPYWAHIIHSKHALWVLDEELDRAIINAARTGPWFENVQPDVLRAGARYWPELSEEARKAVIKVLHSAIQVQPRQTISLALNSGLIEYAMPLLEEDAELKSTYRKIKTSRQRKAEQQMKKLVK